MTVTIPAPIRKMIPPAQAFVAACRDSGWSVHITPESLGGGSNVVSITKHFAPNDRDAFVRLDGEWYGLLSMLKARGGSMWGTDGSGVGGHSAMIHGCFKMNVSGVRDTMAKAIYHAINQ